LMIKNLLLVGVGIVHDRNIDIYRDIGLYCCYCHRRWRYILE
jgi:hypothetical protein